MSAHPSGAKRSASSTEESPRGRSHHHSALKHVPDKRMTPIQAKSLSSPPISFAPSGSGTQTLNDSRSSSPHVGVGFSTPKSRHFGSRDRAYWSSDHPDDRHSKYHHHHSQNRARHNGRHTPFSPYNDNLRHALSRDNRSVQDLTVLTSLVDNRTGYNEDKRVSEEYIDQVSKGKKNAGDIKAYYEQMNGILDGWREVDEILDSQFPREVMRRFGTIEEVEQMKGSNRKRPSWMQDGSGDDDSGYEEESEVESDEDTPMRFQRSNTLTARAASAFSGFWFGSNQREKRGSKANLDDEESTLVSSPKQSAFIKPRQSYGAAGSGPGLSPIQDSGEVSPNISDTPPTHLKAGAVKAMNEENNPVTIENNPKDIKKQAEVGSSKEPRKRNRRIIMDIKDSNSDTDDEMESGEGEVEEGSLDRKLASQREERKARSKHRDVLIPGTGGHVIRLNGKSLSPGENSSEQGSKKKKRSEPGGLSERERMKLLEHVPGRAEKEDERERGASFAININLAVNVLLLAGKAFAVLSSNSVSLLASLVDSALDLLSTVIIFGTSKAIAYKSWHTVFKYPVGKKRFEPLGVCIFSVLMIASFIQVAIESFQRLWEVMHSNESAGSEQLPRVGIIFMVLTIVVKAFMWAIYRKSQSSGVRAIAQDAENDVIFNIASLIFPFVGGKLGWPALDPIGGICLSIYIIWEWIETLAETVTKLSGAAASSDVLGRALYLVSRFERVEAISAIEVFHQGDQYVAETDVILPVSLGLKEAHDLGEIVTYCLESAGYERAYVHLDYDPRSQSGHITSRG